MAANSTMTTTTAAVRIPEVWASETLGSLAKRLNLARTVKRDFEDEVANYGDIINIVSPGSLSANDKTEGQDVTIQTATDTSQQLTLNNHKEVTFSPSDVARAFSKPAIMDDYIREAALVLGQSVESSLTALYASAGSSISGGSAVDLADLRAARRALVTGGAQPNEPVFGYLDEYAVEDLPLTDASALGAPNAVLEGTIAKLGGVNIFESNAVATSGSGPIYHDMIYTREAIAMAVRPLPQDAEMFGGARQTVMSDPQTGLSLRVTMSYNSNALAPQVTMDILWGVKVVRPTLLVDLQHTNA